MSMMRSGTSRGHSRSSNASASGVIAKLTVIPVATSQSRSTAGIVGMSGSATCTLAPATSDGHVSHTDASKAGLASSEVRSAALNLNAARCQSMRLFTLACETSTPLGSPVEPEV